MHDRFAARLALLEPQAQAEIDRVLTLVVTNAGVDAMDAAPMMMTGHADGRVEGSAELLSPE